MKTINIDDEVNVGGCVGKIAKITTLSITVSGRYYDAETPVYDDWQFTYDKADFERLGSWNEKNQWWDISEQKEILEDIKS